MLDHAARSFGIRARLLLAFIGITGFAALAAGAGFYAFSVVGGRLEVVDARVPPVLSALELSRSAERIIAAAPAFLAATDAARRDQVKAALAAEVETLRDTLRELGTDGIDLPAHLRIVPFVEALTGNLALLEDLVARRLGASERIAGLRGAVFKANDETQRLLAPWLEVVGSEISMEVAPPAANAAGGDRARLASLVEIQASLRTAQARVSAVADMLAEAFTVDEVRRLPILTFQLGLALGELETLSQGLDGKLAPVFMEQVGKLRRLSEGPGGMVELRRLELALIDEGEQLIAATGRLSGELTSAVDQLGSAARRDIGEAIRDALSVQRLSTRALIVVVALSMLTAVLIVWLYVGGNIVRRLTALSDSMMAIADGSIHSPVVAGGTDEIAAMGRAVEVFRRNTLERDGLLAEKAQAAEMLEREVEERTADLAQSVGELRALGEVSQAVNSTVDLETVLTTIVAKATQLSNTEAGAIYVYADDIRQFQLRATYGIEADLVAEIRRQQSRLGETAVGEAVAKGTPIQFADVQNDPSTPVLDVIVRAGYRAVLLVPLVGAEQAIGALVVRRRQPGEFSRSTIDLLQTFAAQSVVAIQNAHLFAEIEEKNRQLEVADRYKSHFLASASHDLRQPLHALNLFVAQLRSRSDPEERRLVGHIDAAIGSMNELFEALLDMARLDAGVLQPELTEYPIAPLLARMETTFGEAARAKGLRLRVVQSSAWVRSDFILLERILLNLVSNAVGCTEHGGVVVGCRRGGGKLRIDVRDSGGGIPQDRQQSIFESFVQLAGSKADRRGGLGLGLAIVERLGRLLDHPVEVSSRVGKGSRFSITVPLTAAITAAAENAPAPALVADPAVGKLVVVIDDDQMVLDGMAGVLRRWGCDVVTATSRAAAFAGLAAKGMEPDLIISDYRLAGGESGIDAIENIRAAFNAAIPAFLVSGDTAPERLREASASGLHLLHKPVAPMRLRSMLGQLIKTGAPGGSPAVSRRLSASQGRAPRPR